MGDMHVTFVWQWKNTAANYARPTLGAPTYFITICTKRKQHMKSRSVLLKYITEQKLKFVTKS